MTAEQINRGARGDSLRILSPSGLSNKKPHFLTQRKWWEYVIRECFGFQVIDMRNQYEKKNNSWENLSGFRYAHRGLFRQPWSASKKHPAAASVARGPLGLIGKKPVKRTKEEVCWKEDVSLWKAKGKRIVPENSMEAFRLAVRNGFGSELDVHLTADGCLAVFHDDNLMRITSIDGKIEDMTWQELSKVRLLGTDHRIPLLEEVLDLYTSDAALTGRQDTRSSAPLHLPVIIELKAEGNVSDLCRRVIETVDRYPALNYCIESFDPRVVLWLRRNRPDVIRGQLTGNFMKSKEAVRQWGHLMTFGMWSAAPDILTGPDFISSKFVDRRNIFIRFSHRCGVKQVNWIIRNQKDLDTVDGEGGLGIFERFAPGRSTPPFTPER